MYGATDCRRYNNGDNVYFLMLSNTVSPTNQTKVIEILPSTSIIQTMVLAIPDYRCRIRSFQIQPVTVSYSDCTHDKDRSQKKTSF